jgi:hypothetical protein
MQRHAEFFFSPLPHASCAYSGQNSTELLLEGRLRLIVWHRLELAKMRIFLHLKLALLAEMETERWGTGVLSKRAQELQMWAVGGNCQKIESGGFQGTRM